MVIGRCRVGNWTYLRLGGSDDLLGGTYAFIRSVLSAERDIDCLYVALLSAVMAMRIELMRHCSTWMAPMGSQASLQSYGSGRNALSAPLENFAA